MATKLDRDVVADAVRRARKRAGLSQAALAEIAGISDETVSRLERAAFEPSLETTVALAEALGVSLDYLVGRAGRRRRPSGSRAGSSGAARLAARIEDLSPVAQRALLKLAEMLPRAGKTGSADE